MDLDALEWRFDGPIDPVLLTQATGGAEMAARRRLAEIALFHRLLAEGDRIVAQRRAWRQDDGGRNLEPAAVAAAIAGAEADLAATRHHLAVLLGGPSRPDRIGDRAAGGQHCL